MNSFVAFLLNGGYELQGTLKAITWTKSGDWVNYMTEKSEFSFGGIYLFFYYLDMQFCLPLALLKSVHVLALLY